MKRIYTWAAIPARRNLTVADLRAGKGRRRFTQVTANTSKQAEAAGAAGIDLIICNSLNVEDVRAGNDELFLTAAMPLPDFPTRGDIIREAFRALADGADAVMTARSMKIVSMLAREDIPVMGHLGLVPRKSTWVGGLRAVGRTADEAFELFERFRRLEEAGACMVEAEVIPAPVMTAISDRSGLVTVSLGSGPGADVTYLFMEDILGESENPPRHARAAFGVHRILKPWLAALSAWEEDFGNTYNSPLLPFLLQLRDILCRDSEPSHNDLCEVIGALPETARRPSQENLVELHRRRNQLLGYPYFNFSDLHALKYYIQPTSESWIPALKAFRADAMSGAFPAKEQSVDIDPRELEEFLERLETRGPAS